MNYTIWFWQFALLSKTIIFKWRLIFDWHFLWMYPECLCLFIVEEEGIIFHFCLACSDFYTEDFIHSFSINNMIHPINCEHAWTWNLKFSKNFSVPSQAQVLGSTWPVDHLTLRMRKFSGGRGKLETFWGGGQIGSFLAFYIFLKHFRLNRKPGFYFREQ